METDNRRMEIISLKAGAQVDRLVHSALGLTGDPPDYSTDIFIAVRLAAERCYTLVPIEVYRNEHQWDRPGGESEAIWWCVTFATSNPSVYHPLDEYRETWQDWVSGIDEELRLDFTASSLPLAVSRAILLEELGEKP